MDNEEEVIEYQWVYLDTVETGVMIDRKDMAEYEAKGYVDTPDNYKKPGDSKYVSSLLEDMNKAELEVYAREVFGVEIDRRRSHKNLVAEISKLEDELK